jgi:hypothetical protein
MPTRAKTAHRRTPARPPQDGDRRRGIVVCASLSAFLALTIFGASFAAKITPQSHAAYAAFLAEARALRSGAILFVPVEGNVCRRRLIDNETWQIKDGGEVVCNEAVSWNANAPNQKYFVAVRVGAIRAGFRADNP